MADRFCWARVSRAEKHAAHPDSLVAQSTWKVWLEDGSRYPTTGYGRTRFEAAEHYAAAIDKALHDNPFR